MHSLISVGDNFLLFNFVDITRKQQKMEDITMLKTILKNFAFWFTVFGSSFLVSNVFGWNEQGKAFFYIYTVVRILIILIAAIIVKCEDG